MKASAEFPLSIALIGFPRSGKTTLGKALAALWGWDWCDSDQALENGSGRSPAQWIAEEGMLAFRQQEQAWLSQYVPQGPTVLSTGGGLPCFGDNLHLLKQSFWTVYLQTDFALLAERLYAPPAHTLTKIYPPAELEALYLERHHHYSQAHQQITLSTGQPERALQQVLVQLANP